MSASGHDGGGEREASVERLAEFGVLPAGHNGADDRAEKADHDLGLRNATQARHARPQTFCSTNQASQDQRDGGATPIRRRQPSSSTVQPFRRRPHVVD
jgi:hypothetical protein